MSELHSEIGGLEGIQNFKFDEETGQGGDKNKQELPKGIKGSEIEKSTELDLKEVKENLEFATLAAKTVREKKLPNQARSKIPEAA